MNKRELAIQIVNYVRASINHSQHSEHSEEMKWDEMQEGVGWIDNEVYFAISLLPIDNIVENQLFDAHSVEEYQNKLEQFPINILKFIKFIVVDMKGTKNADMFLFRYLLIDCKNNA